MHRECTLSFQSFWNARTSSVLDWFQVFLTECDDIDYTLGRVNTSWTFINALFFQDLIFLISRCDLHSGGLSVFPLWNFANLMILFWMYNWKPKNFPPGPIQLPVVGSLSFLGDQPFKTFVEVGKKYGNVFSVRLGNSYMVVLNDWPDIKEGFINQNDAFIRRTRSTLYESIFTYDGMFCFWVTGQFVIVLHSWFLKSAKCWNSTTFCNWSLINRLDSDFNCVFNCSIRYRYREYHQLIGTCFDQEGVFLYCNVLDITAARWRDTCLSRCCCKLRTSCCNT